MSSRKSLPNVQFAKIFRQAKSLFESGNFHETISLLGKITQQANYTAKQKLFLYHILCQSYLYIGNYQKAHKIAQLGIIASEHTNPCLEIIDIQIMLAEILKLMEKNTESLEILDSTSKNIKKFKNIKYMVSTPEKEWKRRTGMEYVQRGGNLYYLGHTSDALDILKKSVEILEIWGSEAEKAKAYSSFAAFNMFMGELDQANTFYTKSQKICNKLSSPIVNFQQMMNFIGLGIIHDFRSDSKLALANTKKALFWARQYNNPTFIIRAFHQLGDIYVAISKFSLAINVLKKSLSIAKKIKGNTLVIESLFRLCKTYLFIDSFENAKFVFKEMQASPYRNMKNKAIAVLYRYTKALILSKSNRVRDIGEAQDTFQLLTRKKHFVNYAITSSAILMLCLLLLEEFENSKVEEILDEIDELLNTLEELSTNSRYYGMLAQAYRLKAKISLIHLDFIKSRKFFTKAQKIAEKHGLSKLANQISNDHDNFLRTVSEWDQMKEKNISLEKRLEKIDLYNQIQNIVKRKRVQTEKIKPESPMLFIIITQAGVPLYTKIYDRDWDLSEELFSGFFSAFNTFSDEVFAQKLDRANFGKYTVLIKNITPVMVCYVFEGQSYLAQQKFKKVTDKLRKTESVWVKLERFSQTGEIIQSNSIHELEHILNPFST